MGMPDFLIIGAAKSGTTSIARYLHQHPNIFISTPKEPAFFAYEGEKVCFTGPGDERRNHTLIANLADYQRIFDPAKANQIRGEASVVYLYHHNAPARIRYHLPNAKLIAILRDPVQRAISAYAHLRRDGFEPSSFRDALSAEEQRTAEGWQYLWHYRAQGLYYEQVKRYMDTFPRENLLILTYDQFRGDPSLTVSQIIEFLGADTNIKLDTSSKHNVSGRAKSVRVQQFIYKPHRVKAFYRTILPFSIRSRLRERVLSWNIVPEKPQIEEATLTELRAYYRDNILKLQGLINQDLSGWL